MKLRLTSAELADAAGANGARSGGYRMTMTMTMSQQNSEISKFKRKSRLSGRFLT